MAVLIYELGTDVDLYTVARKFQNPATQKGKVSMAKDAQMAGGCVPNVADVRAIRGISDSPAVKKRKAKPPVADPEPCPDEITRRRKSVQDEKKKARPWLKKGRRRDSAPNPRFHVLVRIPRAKHRQVFRAGISRAA